MLPTNFASTDGKEVMPSIMIENKLGDFASKRFWFNSDLPCESTHLTPPPSEHYKQSLKNELKRQKISNTFDHIVNLIRKKFKNVLKGIKV